MYDPDTGEQTYPPLPVRGLNRSLLFELTPILPSDYLRQPALLYTQALEDQLVYRQVVDEVRASAATAARTAGG